jgi:arylesterase / paraoxonase
VKKLSKPMWIVSGVTVLALLLFALDLLRFAGTFSTLQTGFPATCAAIALGGSSEDIQLDRKRGIAYLSLLDRASVAHGEPINGTVMLLDLNIAAPAPRAAFAVDPEGFRPHGLSLLALEGQPERMFAISHRPDGSHVVEIAERDAGGAFFPRDSVRDDAFVHPNALAAAGPRQFYLVNDTSAADGRPGTLDILLRRGRGSLVYFDGKQAHVVDTELKFPAGLALSPDGTALYLGEAFGKQLRLYRRDRATGVLALVETVALPGAPDNLNVDADGVVWIASHPKLLAFAAHAGDPGKRAPTQVLRFDPRGQRPAGGGRDPRLTQVFGDDGSLLSAGTVAAHWRDEFLVGALMEHKVLICKPSP